MNKDGYTNEEYNKFLENDFKVLMNYFNGKYEDALPNNVPEWRGHSSECNCYKGPYAVEGPCDCGLTSRLTISFNSLLVEYHKLKGTI